MARTGDLGRELDVAELRVRELASEAEHQRRRAVAAEARAHALETSLELMRRARDAAEERLELERRRRGPASS